MNKILHWLGSMLCVIFFFAGCISAGSITDGKISPLTGFIGAILCWILAVLFFPKEKHNA